MKASTMLQSKISRTKKRLSDSSWNLPIAATAVIGLLGALTFCLRSTFLSSTYGLVPLEIPVVATPPEDGGLHNFREKPSATFGGSSLAIVLTDSAFYFGPFKAFGEDYASGSEKFVVQHRDGAPDIDTLVRKVSAYQPKPGRNELNSGIILFIPSHEIPMPVVIQSVAGLRLGFPKARVILGGGIM